MHPPRLFCLFICITTLFLTGCITPRPKHFTDVNSLPPLFVGDNYRAYAKGEHLVIRVSQIAGINVVGFKVFEHERSLYLSPQRISSGDAGMSEFEINVSKYPLHQDWHLHVYWLVEDYSYPISHPGFWSSEKRSAWLRKQIEIIKQ